MSARACRRASWISVAILWLAQALSGVAASLDESLAVRSLDALSERATIRDAAYWRAQFAQESRPDSAKTAELLIDLARVFRPVTNSLEAIHVLTELGVIGSPEHWQRIVQAGAKCDPQNLSVVLDRVASRLPPPVPGSAKTVPLAPTSPAQLQEHYDVIIAGAGTGGCGAAIQVARMGCSVLLVEETDWIGGQMNAAAVTSMDEGGRQVRDRGLYRELCGLIANHYQPLGIDPITAYWHGSYAVEPRVGRVLLAKMLADARGTGTLDLVYRAKVARVFKRDSTVTGAEVEFAGAAPRHIESKVLIDATEWGDVIPLTGARYRAGNSASDAIDRSKRIQDFTWTVVVKQYPEGVPPDLRVTNAPPGYASHVRQFERTLQNGVSNALGKPPAGAPWSWDRFIGYRGMPDSSRTPAGSAITRTHLNFNNDYPLSVAALEDLAVRSNVCRAAVVKSLCLLHYLQTTLGRADWSVADDEGYDTPFQRSQVDAFIAAQPDLKPFRPVLLQFPVMPYARESRRIVGLHTLTAREIERKPGPPIQFADTIALGDYAVDLHGSLKPEFLELDLDRVSDMPSDFGEHGTGPFAIPFRCFIPESVDGFLPAEKNFSQSRLASGATRLQPHTLNMGQAVGALAALAVRQKVSPRAVAPADVQRVLLDAGCALAIAPSRHRPGTPAWRAEQESMLRTATNGY